MEEAGETGSQSRGGIFSERSWRSGSRLECQLDQRVAYKKYEEVCGFTGMAQPRHAHLFGCWVNNNIGAIELRVRRGRVPALPFP